MIFFLTNFFLFLTALFLILRVYCVDVEMSTFDASDFIVPAASGKFFKNKRKYVSVNSVDVIGILISGFDY